MNFFNKLPTITYNNNMARNIMARAKLSDTTKANSRLFIPYTTGGEDRIDTLSQHYYGTPNYTWLIWFANETIDPYYGMALSEYDLEQFIISKYGSLAEAQRRIIHYKNNWATDKTVITVSTFNNMRGGTQKYWQPVLDYNLNVKSYVRRNDDQIVNTNRIASLSFAGVSGEFIVGEEIQVESNPTTYGFCAYADSTTATIQHVTGSFGAGQTVIGKQSGAVALLSDANNLVSASAAYYDADYWTAVTAYEYEVELNERKREILLMDAMYASQADLELKRVMTEL